MARDYGIKLPSWKSINLAQFPIAKENLPLKWAQVFLIILLACSQNKLIEASAGYIQGWLKKLKDDKKFVIEAAGLAQKATDYILNMKGVVPLFLVISKILLFT